MSRQFSPETIEILNEFLSLCRGYVEEAVTHAFDFLEIGSSLAKDLSTEELATKYQFDSSRLERFLHSAASLGLVEETASGKWAITGTSGSRYSWRELHGLFLDEGGKLLRSFTEDPSKAVSKGLLRDLTTIGVLRASEQRLIVNPAFMPFLDPSSEYFIKPLISSYSSYSAPKITKEAIANALRLQPSAADEGKPFSGTGWDTPSLEPFMLAMHATTRLEVPFLLERTKLPPEPYSVLDVGGGLGTVAAGFLEIANRPENTVIYDRTTSIELFERLYLQSRREDETRFHFKGGDFFENPTEGKLLGLTEADQFDVITLGWILHDWSDQDCIRIISKAIRHLKKGGRIIVLECILPDNKRGPTTLLDMTMMLQTEGRERTLSEYRTLMSACGLALDEHVITFARRQLMSFRIEGHDQP